MDDGDRGGRAEMDRPPGGQQSGEPQPPTCRGGCWRPGGPGGEWAGTRFLQGWERGPAGPGTWLDGPCALCLGCSGVGSGRAGLGPSPATALGQVSAIPRVGGGRRWGDEAGRAGWRVGVPGVPAEQQSVTAWATGGAAVGTVACLSSSTSRFRDPLEEPGMAPPSL